MGRKKRADRFANLPADMQDRLGWVKEGGYQVTAMATLIQEELAGSDEHRRRVVIAMCLDRLRTLGDTITDLGDETNDGDPYELQQPLWL